MHLCCHPTMNDLTAMLLPRSHVNLAVPQLPIRMSLSHVHSPSLNSCVYLSSSVQKVTTPDDWKAGIEKKQAWLTRRLNYQPPTILAAAVCSHACEAHVTDPSAVISEALEPFNRMHTRVSIIATSIYRRMGCTNLWKVTENLCSKIQEVVNLLQDILCSALSSVTELRTACSEGTLAYQQA